MSVKIAVALDNLFMQTLVASKQAIFIKKVNFNNSNWFTDGVIRAVR
ncbi:MAG: hypothetical protein M3040_14780 [Bacteroidota bacterium]|nr:hypothetical protein [Bacteroidota bacterium]